ncbi:MAG: excinuclease ABC subunit UvrA [Thermodesulfobacteriota bacterium]
MPLRAIEIKGARQHNLKNIDLQIPLNRMTVITGVSGSGKSSLALDTLYAEGQRRYIETFSPYARQFMERMDRPLMEKIEGIPPAIAIDRKDPVRTSRSTVGTMTEITDYVKLLFARLGLLHCRSCGRPVRPETPAHVWASIKNLPEGTQTIITFPLPLKGLDKTDPRQSLRRSGYDRYWHEGRIAPIENWQPSKKDQTIEIVADRFIFRPSEQTRIMDSLEQAFRLGSGRLNLWAPPGQPMAFSSSLACAQCNIPYPSPQPNLFSFNSPIGACETCRGFGRTIDVDMDLVIPDSTLSIEAGAIKPWGTKAEGRMEIEHLISFCRHNKIPTDVPFRRLHTDQQAAIIDGTDDYHGVKGFFNWLESKTYKMHVRVFLSRFRSYKICPACQGARFKPAALLYRLNGLHLGQIYALNVTAALAFFDALPIPAGDDAGALILDEIRSRLRYLCDVGLGYLTLDRQSRTLSGGEVQRVALASALGASLVNTLYILDEPSIGLHPSDNHRLIRILKGLRDHHNTLVVVEHDPEIIAHSDFMLDIGPGAGENGGAVMYFGPTVAVNNSLTGQYLKGDRSIPIPPKRRKTADGKWLTISGARENNLKDVDVRIPLGRFVCLVGVSGSGKSTLAEEILYKALKWGLNDPQGRPGQHRTLRGHEPIADVVLVDQHPIGRTPRANPVTYTKALDGIRQLLAATVDARRKGFRPGHFSFNVAGGRCETCRGDGFERVEMQFLSDVFITCPDCNGMRFKKELLTVAYRGKNIHDILSMTVDQALDFFQSEPKIRNALNPLTSVGLGYIRLGQPVNTLSGGEAQRLKLSRFLKPGDRLNRFFIFDEPTTGLHFDDIRKLIDALQQLVHSGNTVLVIEHNLDVIKTADWVIELGPEGGDKGGRIVAAGPPEKIIRSRRSPTGRFLKKYLEIPNRFESAGMTAPAVAEAAVNFSEGIAISGAREHNLKNISLSIPRNQLVVLTGVSGSGKSTLAFDILYAEGQRRYLESLAPYVRQYVKILERPEVDHVSGLPPTVAIEQRISYASRRSTVATLTEVYHFLRMLFSKIGSRRCRGCGRRLSTQSREEIADQIRRRYGSQKISILAPKVVGRKGFHKDILDRARRRGFAEARIDGEFRSITAGMALSRYHEHTIELVAGRLPSADPAATVERGLSEGSGSLIVLDSRGSEEIFSLKGACPSCGIGLETLDPRLFSFNSPHGACPKCGGLGQLLSGENADRQDGPACPRCAGSRLRETALAVKINGYSIWDLVQQPALQLQDTLRRLHVDPDEKPIADPLLAEILSRLALLNQLGLSYLSLSRSGDTLSGGEAQRVRLAAQLGSNLTGVLYVLDEPTIGLHPRDNRILITALKTLKERGNSLVVVEHDEETIRAADTLIDLGPGAGQAGGTVVASGPLKALQQNPASVTGACINGRQRRMTSRLRPYHDRPCIKVCRAAEHNLKGIDAEFPLGTLICVTGVSGSGKSTLLKETLFKGVQNRLLKKKLPAGRCRDIQGWQGIDRVLEVDHSPIGRTPRSVPASYVGFLDDIRRLFAATPDARMRGYRPGRFSFNLAEGRCEACKGHGSLKVEMSFLPEVYVDCEDCQGWRFNSDTLAVRYKGKTMAEVLDLTFSSATEFFGSIPSIRRCLDLVCKIGLGYLRLGQPSPTLSGGEAQRIKLAQELVKPSKGRTLYVLDEPTTGLHLSDVQHLLQVLQTLVDAGNTVAVIEHNIEVIKEADYIIDLGPEGGDGGGKIVICGSPADLLAHADGSHTAHFLAKYLAKNSRAK